MQPPIASPFGAPEVSQEERRVFRPHFWRFFGWELLTSLLLFPPMVYDLFWLIMPQAFIGHGPKFLTKLIFCLVFLVPLVNSITLMFSPVNVTRQGIQVPYRKELVEWREIKSVHKSWSQWATVKLQGRFQTFRLPLTLTDFNGFAHSLEEWAPEGNPLREWALKRTH